MSIQEPSGPSSAAPFQSVTSPGAATTAGDGLLLVISGPAGVGKDTVWRAASACLPSFIKVITCTTRPRREGEQEGVHYFFVSDEEFDRLIHEDELLEWAHVHGHRYGVPTAQVFERHNRGQDVVCVIDVQGAQRIRALFPTRSLLVFIKPPAGRETDVLRQRIEGRGSVDAGDLARRIDTANWELGHMRLYDYHIVNEQVEDAARQLCEIVARAKREKSLDGA